MIPSPNTLNPFSPTPTSRRQARPPGAWWRSCLFTVLTLACGCGYGVRQNLRQVKHQNVVNGQLNLLLGDELFYHARTELGDYVHHNELYRGIRYDYYLASFDLLAGKDAIQTPSITPLCRFTGDHGERNALNVHSVAGAPDLLVVRILLRRKETESALHQWCRFDRRTGRMSTLVTLDEGWDHSLENRQVSQNGRYLVVLGPESRILDTSTLRWTAMPQWSHLEAECEARLAGKKGGFGLDVTGDGRYLILFLPSSLSPSKANREEALIVDDQGRITPWHSGLIDDRSHGGLRHVLATECIGGKPVFLCEAQSKASPTAEKWTKTWHLVDTEGRGFKRLEIPDADAIQQSANVRFAGWDADQGRIILQCDDKWDSAPGGLRRVIVWRYNEGRTLVHDLDLKPVAARLEALAKELKEVRPDMKAANELSRQLKH